MSKARNAYYLLLGSVLFVTFYTLFKVTPLNLVLLNSATLLSFFQRLFGLFAFILLFFQILLGSNMFEKAKKFGAWVHKVHVTQGIFAYFFIFFHPFIYLVALIQASKTFNPFYVYSDFCLLCKTRVELYYTLGRVAFWLFTAIFVAAYFRTKPFFRKYWNLLHRLNYVLFFAVSLHALMVGSDVRSWPFFAFFIVANLVVLGISLKNTFYWAKENIVYRLR